MKKFAFGEAIKHMKCGKNVCRIGWNGKGIFIALQNPDSDSMNTLPYVYIVTTNLKSDNPDFPRGRVPWFASQTDMLAEDWCDYEEGEK